MKLVAGDTDGFKIPLIDANTKEAIDESLVSEAWVQIGEDTVFTFADASVLTKEVGNLIVNLSHDFTVLQTGTYRVHAKVKLTDNRLATVTPIPGAVLEYFVTPLTTKN